MAEKIQLPDGSFFPLKPGEDPAHAMMEAASLYPDAFKPAAPKQQGPAPQSGFLPATKAGISSLKSDVAALAGRTGLMDQAAAERTIKEEEEYRKKTFKPTETWGEAPLTKFLETAGGSLPYMAAPLAAGLGAAALPLTGAAATAAGLGATGLASLAQFTGSNLARQMDEGKTLGQTELGAAAAAAVPQAALDVLSFKMMPGIRNILAAGGKEVSEKAAVEIAKQGTTQIAKDYAAATGKAMGAEGLTEAGQQFFERLQAGLSLTDEKARNEYWDSLIGGAVLGGAISPAGRYVERSKQAGVEAAANRAKEADAAAAQQRLAEQEAATKEAFKQTPEFAAQAREEYEKLQERLADLNKRANVKPASDDLAGQADVREARKERDALRKSDEFAQIVADYRAVAPRLKEQEEKDKLAAETFGTAKAPLAPQDMSVAGQAEALQNQIATLDKQMVGKPPVEQQPLMNRRNALEDSLKALNLPSRDEIAAARARLEKAIADTNTKLTTAFATADLQKHNADLTRYEAAIKELDALEKFAPAPKAAEPSLFDLQDQMDAAQREGNVEEVRRLTPMLAEAERQPELPFETGYADENKLAEEIATKREEAVRTREKVAQELAGLQRIAATAGKLSPAEMALKAKQVADARALRDALDKTKVVDKKGTLVMQHEQDWQKLRKDPTNVQYQNDRLRVKEQLEKDIRALTKQGVTGGELEAKKAALADINRRIELGQRYQKTEPARTYEGEYETPLSLSDKRVADLLDRLLPGAIGERPKTAGQVTTELPQADLFDVEANRRAAAAVAAAPGTPGTVYEAGKAKEPTAATVGAVSRAERTLPIVEAQKRLDAIRDITDLLTDVNAEIQKAGRPSAPEKIEALNRMLAQRAFFERQLDQETAAYQRLQEREQAAPQEAATPVTEDLFGPLESARTVENDLRDKLKVAYAERDQIKADLNRRGQLAVTQQMQDLVDKFSKFGPARLRNAEAEIDRLESELERATGRRSERFDEFVQAREAERGYEAPQEGQRELPGFGLKQFKEAKKPVDATTLANARTKLVSLQDTEESLRKSIAEAGTDPTRYLREVAIQKQKELDIFNVRSGQTAGMAPETVKVLKRNYPEEIKPTERDQARYAALAKEIKLFNNLIKGNNRKALQAALQKNLAEQTAARANLEKLESRQRMYEQQQAAAPWSATGEAEAKRLLAGEGYRTYTGKTRVKPTRAESWGIIKAAPTPTAAPSALAKAEKEVATARRLQEVEKLPAESTARIMQARTRIADLSRALAALSKETDNNFSVEKTTQTLQEIDQLQDFIDLHGNEAQRSGADRIVEQYKKYESPAEAARLAKQMEANIKNTEAQVDALADKLESLRQEFDDINNSMKAAVVKEPDLQDVIARAEGVDAAHTKAATAYAVARRDYLVFQYEAGKRIRQVARDTAAALEQEIAAQASDPTLAAVLEENKAAVAAQKASDKRLEEAQAKLSETRKQLQAAKRAAQRAKETEETARREAEYEEQAARRRGQEGLGLPGTRYERDTTTPLATAVQINARKMLGKAQTELAKAQESDDPVAVRRATAEVQRYERELNQAYAAGEVRATPVGEGAAETAVEQPGVVEGTRLAPRRQGPVVRQGTQAPSQFLSGTAESRDVVGKGNRPRQIGAVRLRASDLDPKLANDISLATIKQQLAAATGDRKAQLQEAYDRATADMTSAQVKASIANGEKLIGSEGTLEVIGAREKAREALEAVKKAEADVKAAKTPAAKEIAQDSLDTANTEFERAEARLEAARAMAELQPNTARKQAIAAVEEALSQSKAAPKTRAQSAVEDIYGDLEPTTYSTATRTESNPAVREAILDQRLIDALDRLAVDGETDLIRQNAKDLAPLVLRTRVILDPNLQVEGKDVPAAYSPELNAVIFRPTEITDEDIIHEVTHAATMRVLTMPEADLTDRQRNAKKELEAIYKQASKNKALMDEHGLKNMKEFVSEVQSNAEFRAAINKQPWYSRLWHALTRLFSKAPAEAIADRASRLVKELYLPSQKIAAPKLPSVFRSATPKSALVGYEPSTLEKLKGNFFGLAGRVQHFDRLAAADAGIVAAEGAGKLSSTEAFNAQYFMRMGDNVTQAAGQFITNGPVKIVADKRSTGTEYRYESVNGANLVDVSEHLERMAKAGSMDPKEAERMATSLLAGDRASATPNGWERLMTDPAKRAAARAEYDADVAFMKRNPEAKKHMDALTQAYKKYNDGLLDFTVDCGFMSKAEAERLKKTPYVPFYRIDNGVVKLYTGSEHPIRIGNIKENPDLARFLGDTQTILPLLTSAVQNTFMLTRAAMNNKATLETTSALYKAGFVSKSGKGPGPANADTVHYKLDGVDHFATIDSDTFGIPAHLIVKGMEGIKTTIPALVQAMGMPANVLRKFVVRSPAYVVRQILREPINSFLQSGIDGVPVANALKELSSMRAGRSPSEAALMRGLVVSSNVYTGDRQDMTKFLNDLASGRGKWDKALAWMDTLALQADAATRAVAYNDALKKGLSEAQAQFRALEMQNFSRRGLSPSMQMLSTLIPFFNAQVQGLDVLYRSLTGKMPFAKQLDIQRKIVARTTMLAATALAYAFAMQDNDEYKKATPAERYGNLFVPIPGSKDMLKVPMGFELGTLTMGLMQSLVDSMAGDTAAKDAAMGMGKLILNSAPGVIPTFGKPLLEAAYGTTLQGPIESQREKMLEASKRYRSNTTEVAKVLGGFTGAVGVSPIMLEHLVRGYTGSLGVSLMSLANPLLRSAEAGEKPTAELSKTPFIGGLFQTGEGRFLVERAYDYMEDVIQAQQTYKDMVRRGNLAEAKAFAQQRAELLAGASAAGGFRQRMGEYFAQERAIRDNPKLTQARKDDLLEKLKQIENREAEGFYSLRGRTTRQ